MFNTDIKPIETFYNGYRFRSRLEARWAVFFDVISADWQYEPEGFKLQDGSLYLPDFYVKNVRGRGAENIYIEIKAVLTEYDIHRIELFSRKFPIIIFGQLPRWDIKTNSWEFDFGNGDYFFNLQFSEYDCYPTYPVAGNGGGLVLEYPDDPYDYVDHKMTINGYEKALQARFEHGETPKMQELSAQDAVYKKLDAMHSRYNLSKPDQKVDYLHEATKLIAALPGSVERQIYSVRVAELVGIKVDAIVKEVDLQRKRLLTKSEKADTPGLLELAEQLKQSGKSYTG